MLLEALLAGAGFAELEQDLKGDHATGCSAVSGGISGGIALVTDKEGPERIFKRRSLVFHCPGIRMVLSTGLKKIEQAGSH